MLLRFVVGTVDDDAGVRLGLFTDADELRKDPRTPAHVRARLDEGFRWLGEHLARPPRFSRRGHADWAAVCWFRDTATEAIAVVRDMAAAMRECGLDVRQIETTRPGKVVYEDEQQVVAIPFRDTGA